MNYTSFQAQVSSEKLTLATVEASKRLMAWTLHSGSIYKISNFDIQAISSILDSGTAYSEVSDLASVTASKFYNDRENKILYLRTTGSDNPNSRILILSFKLFFSNAPITLPYDLSSGMEVYWEPLIKSTSAFGVEIDTINQASEAIEGSGTLSLLNDGAFWPAYFDKLTFENKACAIYSHNRNLSPNEAKMIFNGFIEKKSYSPSQIQFSLKDLISQFRAPIALDNIEDISDQRANPNLLLAKQRMILGRVYGHRLVNIDEALEGYPLTGTISVTVNTTTVTGSGTSFKSYLSPNDILVIDDVEYTIATITSDTALTLSSNYNGTSNISGGDLIVKPEIQKRYMNRKWFVAGHTLRQPVATIGTGSTISRIIVDSTKDIYAGDLIYVGTYGVGEVVQVGQVVSSTLLVLSSSLITVPSPGTTLFKPAVQNVRIDDTLLRFDDHFTFDNTTGVLTLLDTAELDAGQTKQAPGAFVFTSGSAVVTGSGFNSLLKPGDAIACVSHDDFVEILSVDSDTQVTLRSNSSYSSTINSGLYKNFILDPENSVVTCDVLGRTDDDTATGTLLNTAPKITKALLTDLGLLDQLDIDSFNDSDTIAYQPIGLAIPDTFDSETTPIYRDVLTKINQSVFGSIIQNNEFQLSYLVLQPKKDLAAIRLDEADVLNFSITSNADKLVKTSIVSYRPKEFDYLSKDSTKNYEQKTSDTATYLIKTDRTRNFETVLSDSQDALRHACRWALILENASTSVKIVTKLQGISLEVGNIIDISHRKFYERLGTSSKRKLGLVESVKKTGSQVEIVFVDLSNSFNKVGNINALTTTWSDTDEDGRIYGGFITDQYGLIDNSEDSFLSNLIW